MGVHSKRATTNVCVCVGGGGGGGIIVIKYWPILRRSFLDDH